jgi:SAM-dependent methyltransferase
MFEGSDQRSVQAYASVGRQAVQLIERALQASGRSLEEVGSVLDFGCGHGRVLRYLVQRVGPGRITVCDLDHLAARFCVEEFGVTAIPGSTDLSRVPFGTYDVIWMGSVLTHVDREVADALLTALSDRLLPGGSLVFTTLGPSTLSETEDLGRTYRDRREAILARLEDEGFCYEPYQHYRGDEYGLAWYTPQGLMATVERAGGGRLTLAYDEHRGWDDLQDVWAFRRSDAQPVG